MTADRESAPTEALARLYRDCFGELVGYLENLVGSRAAAEDLAQEAGIRLFEAGRREALDKPKGYLFHVATNLARDQLRRRVVRDRVHHELAREELTAAGADAVVAARDQLARVVAAMEQLPPRAREVVRLSRAEGYTHGEIAERLGITPKTVENHLARGVAQLVRLLGIDSRRGLGDGEP